MLTSSRRRAISDLSERVALRFSSTALTRDRCYIDAQKRRRLSLTAGPRDRLLYELPFKPFDRLHQSLSRLYDRGRRIPMHWSGDIVMKRAERFGKL